MTAVLITGATGFIGAELVERLLARGDEIVALVRDEVAARRRWPGGVTIIRSLGELPPETAIDAIVNLAGASVASGRWTAARRKVLLASRIETTRAIARLIERLERRPAVLVQASAIGVYGDRGDERLGDDAPAGTGFMADLVSAWEDEAARIEATGFRVCRLRLGMVFDWSGGPLPLLALPARLGGAAVLGDGRQWAPWIHLEDALRLILTALDDARYAGSINAVAPDLVTQSELTHALAWRFRRPQWVKVPAWPLRVALGEMSDLFLASQRVEPDRLRALGFRFLRPTLPEALDRHPADETRPTPTGTVLAARG